MAEDAAAMLERTQKLLDQPFRQAVGRRAGDPCCAGLGRQPDLLHRSQEPAARGLGGRVRAHRRGARKGGAASLSRIQASDMVSLDCSRAPTARQISLLADAAGKTECWRASLRGCEVNTDQRGGCFAGNSFCLVELLFPGGVLNQLLPGGNDLASLCHLWATKPF